MVSSYYLTAVVFLMCCSITIFAQEKTTFQHNRNTLNGTSNSTNCNLQIDESKIEDVLRLQHKPTTNTVKLKVTVVSENETRCFPKMEWPWANEIGRTIISLARRAKDTILPSPLVTWILEVETKEVAIQVMEVIDGCLPPGDQGSDRIFDSLLHRLAQSKEMHSFELCRPHVEKFTHYGTYNCCQITRGGNLTICADYSSVVVNYALPALIVVFLISFFMVIPFVLEHIITYPTIEFYKTSDSHISLTSIVSMMFFEGRGPAISLFRRCIFVGLSSLVFLPDFFGSIALKIIFGAWAGLFVVSYDVQMTHEECEQKCIEECKKKCTRAQWDKNIISIFSIPFSLLLSSTWSKDYCCKDLCSKGLCSEVSCCESFCKYLRDLFYGFFICISMILYFSICFPFLVVVCLVKFTIWDILKSFIWPSCPAETWKKCLLSLIRLPTLVISVFFTGMIFMFAVAIVVGFTLNGEYFSPFIVPIVTLITYLWKNWTFSVEGKCLELKTSIIKICKEKAPAREDKKISVKNSTNNNELTGMDRLRDVLCSCLRDTSEDPHTWKSLKNLCPCCTKSTERDASGNGGCQPSTSKTTGSNDSAAGSGSSGTTKNDNEDNELTKFNNEKGKGKGKGKSRVTKTNTDTNKPSTSGNSDNVELPNIIESGKEDEGKVSKSNTDTYKPSTSGNSDNAKLPNIIESGKEDEGKVSKSNTDTYKPSTSGNRDNAVLARTDDKEDNKLIIKFDKHGEAMISKKLYEKISKEILPLENLLFYFFRRVIFICFYAFVMFTVMILARDSGVSDSVQAINAIVGALIPFIFDTIITDHHSPDKTCKNMATRERLEHIMKVNKRENNTILVEMININNDESQKDEGIEEDVEPFELAKGGNYV